MTTRQPPLALNPDLVLAPRSLRHFSRCPFLAMNQAPKPSMSKPSHDVRVLFPSPLGRGTWGEGQTSSLSSPSALPSLEPGIFPSAKPEKTGQKPESELQLTLYQALTCVRFCAVSFRLPPAQIP